MKVNIYVCGNKNKNTMTKSTRNTTEMQKEYSKLIAPKNDLTISIRSSYVKSPQVQQQKEGENPEPNLLYLFEETLKEKGEPDIKVENKKGDNVMEFENNDLSFITLQSFLLKAEALGKKIKYEKTYSVIITD